MDKIIDKRTAILEAALELLVAQGFHNTPMSQVAKKAGVSAGIIYHYFASKEELIHELYREVKTKLSEALIAGEPHLLPGVETVRQLWFNAFNYYVSHPKITLFLEQYDNSPFYKQWNEKLDDKIQVVVHKIQQDMEAGLLIELPVIVFYNLTFGVAISLAKQQIAGLITLDQNMLEKIAGAVVRSVQPI